MSNSTELLKEQNKNSTESFAHVERWRTFSLPVCYFVMTGSGEGGINVGFDFPQSNSVWSFNGKSELHRDIRLMTVKHLSTV